MTSVLLKGKDLDKGKAVNHSFDDWDEPKKKGAGSQLKDKNISAQKAVDRDIRDKKDTTLAKPDVKNSTDINKNISKQNTGKEKKNDTASKNKNDQTSSIKQQADNKNLLNTGTTNKAPTNNNQKKELSKIGNASLNKPTENKTLNKPVENRVSSENPTSKEKGPVSNVSNNTAVQKDPPKTNNVPVEKTLDNKIKQNQSLLDKKAVDKPDGKTVDQLKNDKKTTDKSHDNKLKQQDQRETDKMIIGKPDNKIDDKTIQQKNDKVPIDKLSNNKPVQKDEPKVDKMPTSKQDEKTTNDKNLQKNDKIQINKSSENTPGQLNANDKGTVEKQTDKTLDLKNHQKKDKVVNKPDDIKADPKNQLKNEKVQINNSPDKNPGQKDLTNSNKAPINKQDDKKAVQSIQQKNDKVQLNKPPENKLTQKDPTKSDNKPSPTNNSSYKQQSNKTLQNKYSLNDPKSESRAQGGNKMIENSQNNKGVAKGNKPTKGTQPAASNQQNYENSTSHSSASRKHNEQNNISNNVSNSTENLAQSGLSAYYDQDQNDTRRNHEDDYGREQYPSGNNEYSDMEDRGQRLHPNDRSTMRRVSSEEGDYKENGEIESDWWATEAKSTRRPPVAGFPPSPKAKRKLPRNTKENSRIPPPRWH